MSHLFNSAHAALAFAYDLEQSDPMGSSLGRGTGKAGGMNRQEWRSQASLIRDYVAKLEQPMAREYIDAFYAHGWRRTRAQSMLLSLPAVALCLENSAVPVGELLPRYCDNGRPGTPSLRQLAKQLGLHHTTVMRAEERLKAALSDHFADTEQRLFADFDSRGIAPANTTD